MRVKHASGVETPWSGGSLDAGHECPAYLLGARRTSLCLRPVLLNARPVHLNGWARRAKAGTTAVLHGATAPPKRMKSNDKSNCGSLRPLRGLRDDTALGEWALMAVANFSGQIS